MLSVVLAALYGESDPRSNSRVSRHPQIVSCLRSKFGEGETATWDAVIETLRRNNFIQESLFLSNSAQQEHGKFLVDEQMVITLACPTYPQNLINNLGPSAPPLFWISDPAIAQSPPWLNEDGSQRVCVGAIGCRKPLNIGHVVATRVGEWVAKHQFLGISGGAEGCDTAFGNSAMSNGGKVIHILPYGMRRLPRDFEGLAISVCPPNEPFSTGRAMERNALIYALAHTTFVCSVRYRIGGSWQGANSAIKAKRPVVVADWTSSGFAATQEKHSGGTYGLAQKALVSLGAHSLRLELESFRKPMDDKLDAALDWSFEYMAENINTGLFAE